MCKKNSAFTMIELIAALVILSIIVLISVPIIVTIKDSAKINSYKRSVDAYGHAIEIAIANELINNGEFPSDLRNIKIDYKGSKVICNIMQLKENGGVYLSECLVDDIEVKDSKTDDGWYHYNEKDYTDEDYVDMYGEYLKKSLKRYIVKNKRMPDSYEELQNNYNGKKIDCDVTIRWDNTLYLTKCKINNKEILDESSTDGYYHYGIYYTNEDYIDMYGKIMEKEIKKYYKINKSYPSNMDDFDFSYINKDINCKERVKNDGTVFLTECKVENIDVKDSKTDDGWYHYNEDYTNEEYVDLYGKAFEKSLINYYNSNGVYPQNFSELVIEDIGKNVNCDISLNWDNSVYMTSCKVNNISVLDESTKDNYYHYGNYEPYRVNYEIGDKIEYNGIYYYVIKKTDASEENLIVIKEKPLTVSEVNTYGAGHVNVNNLSTSNQYYRKAYNKNGYGGMAFNSNGVNGDYSQSDIKYVVDAWASSKTNSEDIVEARLIKIDELRDNLKFEVRSGATWNVYAVTAATPKWAVNSQYTYWTMSPYQDYYNIVWAVGYYDVSVSTSNTRKAYDYVVRPVIVIKKSAISS